METATLSATTVEPVETGEGASVLSQPAALRVLALVVLGASLIQALSGPLLAWSVPEQWPRAEVLSRAAFLAILAAGFAVQALGVVLARHRPTAGLAVAFGVYAAVALGLDAPAWVTAGNLAVAVVVFFVALRGSVASTTALLAATLVAFCAVQWIWFTPLAHLPAEQWWSYLLRMVMNFAPLVLACAVLGALWGRQARRVAAERREAEAARREHEQRVARAKEDERERIAQELHDVAAEHLAGLLSLANAAVELAEDDPRQAIDLIDGVRAEGRFAVASLHGALTELRSPDAARTGPTPDARQVEQLVQQWRSRGMAVELLALGDLDSLPAVVSVTAYRTVREALANAAKHAPGAPVRARVLADVELLTVTVENGAPARTASPQDDGIGLGWGLSGLRRRLELLKGTLDAGPTADGGWRVLAELPLTVGYAAQ